MSIAARKPVLPVIVVCAVLVGWLAWACMPAFAAPAEAPETLVPEAVTSSSVVLRGVLDPKTGVFPVAGGTYQFFYGVGSVCGGGGVAPESPGMFFGLEAEPVSQPVSGLLSGTEYSVCLVATNGKGEVSVGSVVHFTTARAPEAPETGAASEVGDGSVRLGGVLNPNGKGEPGTYEFLYKASATECQGGESTGPVSTSGAREAVSATATSGLAPETQYIFCLVVHNEVGGTTVGSPVSFTTGSVKPEITGESFSAVGSHGGSLTAQVNMENTAGHYYYAYGVPGELESGKPQVTPVVGLAASGELVVAPGQLENLAPNTEYDFQILVTNSHGETAEGPIGVLKTLPVTSQGLPDNRVYEMVTPVENQNADVFVPQAESVLTTNGTPTLQPFQVSPEGNAVTYTADATTGGIGTTSSGLGNQYLAKRSSGGGWAQANIEPLGRKATIYQGFTNNLSTGLVVSGEEPGPLRLPPLSPEAPGEGYRVLYACTESQNACTAPEENQVIPPNPYQPLFVGPFDRNAEEFGAQGFGRRGVGIIHNGRVNPAPVFAGAAESAANGLLFEANDALLKGNGSIEKELATSVSKEIAKSENSNYLYDSIGGNLSLVDILPDGSVAGGATFGGPPFPGNEYDPPGFSNVISSEGSRIYWTDLHTGVVYLREDGTSTVQVSEGMGAARYWTSAADGQYAFYTEMAAGSNNEGLFRFDAETGTREQLVVATAHVLGVIGSSESGDNVYFVAEEVLSGADSEGVLPQAHQPNLYLQHDGGEPVFIATLPPPDGSEMEPFNYSLNYNNGEFGDWQPALSNRTAEVSANGAGVVFMSTASLPVVGFPGGYPTGGADEVYVFDARADRLFCASCSSSGEQGGAQGFLPISWTATYIPQWISADGDRVFFDSSAPLVPQDTNGVQDVYEWEREGTGNCLVGSGADGACIYLLSGGVSKAASWFIGGSANGDDVFVVTRAQLVPEDQNGADDLYDVRVNGVRPVSPPACTGSGCQGVPAPPPTFATPPSVTFSGVGNFPPPLAPEIVRHAKKKTVTRAQRLSRALKACRVVPKRSRASCEARARRLYGAKSKAKKPAKGRK